MQDKLDEYYKDKRVVSCQYCKMKEIFDVNNDNDRMALDCWDEYHSSCRKRIEEQSLILAMRLNNKTLLPWLVKELR